MRQLLQLVTGAFVGMMFLVGLGAVASTPDELPADCVLLEDLEVAVCPLDTTTTSTTTTTSPGSSTTLPPTTTTTVPAATTTLAPTTTSTLPSTTTTTTEPPSSIELTNDLVITEDETRSNFTIDANGHEILIDGADITWTNFEVRDAARVMWYNNCGVANLSDGLIVNSGITDQLGFYPLHWHLCGDTTRGSVVEDVTVEGGRHHAFVPHGSNGITFSNITALDTVEAAFWWDPPGSNDCTTRRRFCTADNSNDIIVDGLLVDGVVDEDGPNERNQEGVVLGAGSGNVMRNSRVVNVSGRRNCAAYVWNEAANQNVGGNVWTFEDNHGESDCFGIFVWQNDGNLHEVTGFTGDGISHGAYKNFYHYENVDVPEVVVHAAGWTMVDSHAGDVILRRHKADDPVEWANVTLSSLTVKDRGESGDVGIPFVVDGTNLACSEVEWVDPHPDTQVSLNGQECVNPAGG